MVSTNRTDSLVIASRNAVPHLALLQHDNLVAAGKEVDVMGDEEPRHAPREFPAYRLRKQVLADVTVDGTQGIVEEQKLRTGGVEGPGEAHPATSKATRRRAKRDAHEVISV